MFIETAINRPTFCSNMTATIIDSILFVCHFSSFASASAYMRSSFVLFGCAILSSIHTHESWPLQRLPAIQLTHFYAGCQPLWPICYCGRLSFEYTPNVVHSLPHYLYCAPDKISFINIRRTEWLCFVFI